MSPVTLARNISLGGLDPIGSSIAWVALIVASIIVLTSSLVRPNLSFQYTHGPPGHPRPTHDVELSIGCRCARWLPDGVFAQAKTGVGTGIVKALEDAALQDGILAD